MDTGATFSIIPQTSASTPSGPALAGPDGKAISCWGSSVQSLRLGGHWYEWTFLLAAVQFPILGVDFLRAFNLLVDSAGGRLGWPAA